jgi:hypothetical protein
MALPLLIADFLHMRQTSGGAVNDFFGRDPAGQAK